jgi:hypothetical protein
MRFNFWIATSVAGKNDPCHDIGSASRRQPKRERSRRSKHDVFGQRLRSKGRSPLAPGAWRPRSINLNQMLFLQMVPACDRFMIVKI